MKLLTILVPTYQPRPYVGATPVPYQSGTVDQFEKELAELSLVMFRSPNAVRLRPDAGGRWTDQQIVTPYQIVVRLEDTAAGDAISLALKTFKLESLTVLKADGAEDFNLSAAGELQAGIHPWNEEV